MGGLSVTMNKFSVPLHASQVKFMILPELLKRSPALTKVQNMKKKSDEKGGSKAKPFKGKKN